MGREIKRVPEGFDWPIGTIWPGKMLSMCSEISRYFENETHDNQCRLCRKYAALSGYGMTSYGCPDFPFTEPPKGDAYQLWETTSEGSPMSPPFKTPEELAQWLTDNNTSSFGSETASYSQWLEFIRGPGWAPSAVIRDGKLISGVVGMQAN